MEKKKKLSRNDPCWCGSGKKYKKCHMDSDLKSGVERGPALRPAPGVILKNQEQIDGIRRSCQLTREILDRVSEFISEGVSTEEIDRLVHQLTVNAGAHPAPLNYNGYPKSVCTSVNDVICHGIPDDELLRSGDIINVDVTCILNGYFGDASRMFMIGNVSDQARKLVDTARECMEIGIQQVKPYRDLGEVGYAIESHARSHGYSVVRDYGGHGVGIRFHEEPHVHHYGSRNRGIVMLPGMIFTIEPMINEGSPNTRLLSDNWTAITTDNKLSAQWEHTVLVTDEGHEILTA